MRDLKKLSNCLKFSISKDETRLQLNGVTHNSKLSALVSTDGHVATVLKTCYNKKLADIIIDSNFCTIDREYPNIAGIIPDFSTLEEDHYKIEKKHYIKTKIYNPIFFCGEGVIKIDKPEKFLFALDTNKLKTIADGSKYTVFYRNELSPVIFMLNKVDFFVVMPVRVPSDE